MTYIMNLIYQYGLSAMFFIILIEYACFPISSEFVLPFSGAFSSFYHIPYVTILISSIAAGIIGTSICYLVGRYGGGSILTKLKTKFPKMAKGIDASYDKFNQYGAFAVCIARVIPICRTYIAFVAGAANQKYSIFFISSLIGISVWNTILIGLGYFLGENWDRAAEYYSQYKDLSLPFFLFIGLHLIVKSRRKKRTNQPES